MASPEVIDLETLLQPISEDAPCGTDGRADRSPGSIFYRLKDSREKARNAERNIMLDDENRSIAQEEWRNILALAPTILAEHSKDLEVCAWLLEGLVRIHGFAGLRDGFKLTLGLVEQYWDHLYPVPDEDDDEDIREFRCAPFAGLNGEGRDGTLIQPLRSVPITEERDYGPYAYWQYQQASDIEKVHDEDTRAERIASAGVSIELFDKAINDSSVSFCQDLVDDLEASLETFQALSDAFDQKAESYSPPTSNIRNCLREILGAVKHKTADKLAAAAPLEDTEHDATETGTATPAGGASPTVAPGMNIADAVVKSREDAFRQLLKIAEFFRKTEPHSPVSYAVEKAVRWGRLPLNELMRELIQDNQSRETYEMLTGVNLEDE